MVTTATLVMITSIRSVSVYLDIFPFFFYFGETNIPSRRCLRVCENFRPREHRRSGYRTSNHSSGLLCCCVLEPQYSFEGTRQSRYDRKLLLMLILVFIRLFLSFNVRFPSILNFQEVPAGVLRKADLVIHQQGGLEMSN